MKFASVALCYREERLIGPHLRHLPNWIEEKLVLVSDKPWQGSHDPMDKTPDIAKKFGAGVIVGNWATEEDQRNAAQEYFTDFDWIIVCDPDEYMTRGHWNVLKMFLEHAEGDAYVCEKQITYYKDGKVDPPEDYKQIIAVRPTVRFVDKRVVDHRWDHAPVTLHHLSWRRTDAEVLSKITHYSHASELIPNWYKDVWLSDRQENVHPKTPESLRKVVPAELPKELTRLGL